MTIDSFSGANRFLSNFYPSKIYVGGVPYPTVEHAYQAYKCNPLSPTFHDDVAAIRLASSAGLAKRLGRDVELRPDWERMKIGVMNTLLVKKFSSDELAEKLLATGDALLVEGNTWGDTFWGVCRGQGANWLGTLLMVVRSGLVVLRNRAWDVRV